MSKRREKKYPNVKVGFGVLVNTEEYGEVLVTDPRAVVDSLPDDLIEGFAAGVGITTEKVKQLLVQSLPVR